MKRPIADREQIVSSFVKKEHGKEQAAQLLDYTKRTLETHVKQFVVYNTAELVDHRTNIKRYDDEITQIHQFFRESSPKFRMKNKPLHPF